MKHSIPISAVILIVAGLVGWWIDGQIAAARALGQTLVTESTGLGISAAGTRKTRGHRPDPAMLEAEARKLAADYLDLPRARQRIVINSREVESELEIRIAETNARQRKIFLGEVLAAMELDPSIDVQRVINQLRDFARMDPQGALELFARHYETLKRNLSRVGDIVSTSIGSWAEDDVLGAARWIKDNSALFPEAMNAQSLVNLFHLAATKEPELAFSLIPLLGLDESRTRSALISIIIAPATDEARNATLAALHAYRDGTMTDKTAKKLVDETVGYFAWTFRDEGFDTASKWIASAKLSPKEVEKVCEELLRNYIGDEQAQWIEWLGGNLSTSAGKSFITILTAKWTERDYEAAGQWLVTLPDGPTKSAAVSGYVWAIGPYDSEAASRWAVTLPAGDGRESALARVLNGMPKNPEEEKQAAEDFSREHGLK